jgi:hypothetical protein
VEQQENPRRAEQQWCSRFLPVRAQGIKEIQFEHIIIPYGSRFEHAGNHRK